MLTFKNFIAESINDAGRLKAIFVVGVPGAGKSYTISRLTGSVSPRIVNTDKAGEFLSSKWGSAITSQTWPDFKDAAQRITMKNLSNYVNGMLPLFIDGTSNSAPHILQRMGILQSFGYDVGLISIVTPLETAIARASARAEKIGRHVDEDFIRKVAADNAKNTAYLKNKVSFFTEIKNDSDELNDAAMLAAFKKTEKFFSSPIENPVGVNTIEQLQAANEKYLVPTITSQQSLDANLQGWYRS